MSMLIKAQHANLRTVAISMNTKYIQYVGQTSRFGDRHGLNIISLWFVATMMPKNAAKTRCTCMYIRHSMSKIQVLLYFVIF